MRKTTKVWLIIAACLVLLGCLLFAGVSNKLDWDEYETNTYVVSEAFDSISINTDTADIVLSPSDDGRCRVECHEGENTKHSVAVEKNVLVVGINKTSKSWLDYIGFSFDTPKITVYLPGTQYTSLHIDESTGGVKIPDAFMFKNVDISLSTGDVHFCGSASETVKIKASTGAIRVENISAGALDLKVTTGKVTVSGVTCAGDVTVGVTTGKTNLSDTRCKNVISSGSTGDIDLNHVIAAETFSIRRSTGDVKFDGSDAAEIIVKTDTGDVRGTLLSGKNFMAQTDLGDVDVPKSVDGGRCEITTDTGDIEITIG